MIAFDGQSAPALPVSNVMIVDDHPLYSDALESALKLGFSDCSIKKAGSLREALDLLETGFVPDLVMFDLKLPDVNGMSGFESLREKLPDARVLIISSLASRKLVHALLDAGAMGFMQKDAPATTLKFAISEIAAGRRFIPVEYVDAEASGDECAFSSAEELKVLTPQQIKILKLICLGKPNKQIAYELSLAEATVKAHITALLRRLGVRNRTQAVVFVESVLARQSGSEPEASAFLSR